MGRKVKIFAALGLTAVAAALLVPKVPGHYFASDATVKSALRAIHSATAELRSAIGVELRALKGIEPDVSTRHHPTYGAYDVRINESGTIVARSQKYDVVLVFRPLPGGAEVPWRCLVSPAAYVIEGCEPGGEE